MKSLVVTGSLLLTFISLSSAQESVNYTVRYKPLTILDQSSGKILTRVPRNETLTLSSYNPQCDCFYAKYLGYEGVLPSKPWLNDVFAKSQKNQPETVISDSVKRLLTEYRLANDKGNNGVFTVEKSNVVNADLKKTFDLISKWGYTNGKRIAEGKIWLGMTIEMALDSWGIPYRINRSHGNWGEREQWIYSNAYLYFENGTLAEIFKLSEKVE